VVPRVWIARLQACGGGDSRLRGTHRRRNRGRAEKKEELNQKGLAIVRQAESSRQKQRRGEREKKEKVVSEVEGNRAGETRGKTLRTSQGGFFHPETMNISDRERRDRALDG